MATVKMAIEKDGKWEILNTIKDDCYDGIYEECTSILNSTKEITQEVEDKLDEQVKLYEASKKVIFKGEVPKVEYRGQTRIELNPRKLRSYLSRNAKNIGVKDYEKVKEHYIANGELELIAENGKYLIGSTKTKVQFEIGKEAFDNIVFNDTDVVQFETTEVLLVDNSGDRIEWIETQDETRVYLTGENSMFSQLLGQLAIDEKVAEQFKEKKEKKEKEERKKTVKVEDVKVKKEKKKKEIEDIKEVDENLDDLDDLNI